MNHNPIGPINLQSLVRKIFGVPICLCILAFRLVQFYLRGILREKKNQIRFTFLCVNINGREMA